MVLLGCRPEGRNIEQHDIFFGIAKELADLVPSMKQFWPRTTLHIDAYTIVESVDGFHVSVEDESNAASSAEHSLFFINLGGYRPPDFEEYHKKLVVVAKNISEAVTRVKRDSFYLDGQSLSTKARSHVDDKFEVDEILDIQTLIGPYRIVLTKNTETIADSVPQIGYIPLSKIEKNAIRKGVPL